MKRLCVRLIDCSSVSLVLLRDWRSRNDLAFPRRSSRTRSCQLQTRRCRRLSICDESSAKLKRLKRCALRWKRNDKQSPRNSPRSIKKQRNRNASGRRHSIKRCSERLLSLRSVRASSWRRLRIAPSVFGSSEMRSDASRRSSARPKGKCALCAKDTRSEEHTSELQSRLHLVCRLLLEK